MSSLATSRTHRNGVLALIIANIIWGAAAPIFKLSLQNIPPFTLAFLRFFGASLLLYPFAIKAGKIKHRDILTLIIISFFGVTFNIAFFFWGLMSAPAINATVIASSGPVFLCLGGILFLKEKPRKKLLGGLLISLLGVIIIIGQPIFTEGFDGQLVGNIFFLLAMIFHTAYTILYKKSMSHYSTFLITYWMFLIGSLTFLPFFLYETVTVNPLFSLDIRGLVGIGFGIFLSSALAYFLFDWGLKRIPSQEIGIFAYLDPIIAAAIAIPLLGETVSSLFLLGSLLIFGGIAIAENRLHYHPLHKL
ncbi:hypothetical protein A3D77_02895 [Candidatus Gottesmanbacteria bacterium RIFCSPHIGHO2_02_FULL_39_11]|uniref:EamA domain-containing protein n=1 Tax=Candidatus Gottesmanbacteria bacterium RIFCSPHIGHO2_02_FULL_39_11 TaxID=1798382 RepID=A0A1F5ZWJ5_9BACT|nr:MAG: hypothetical protein A3D77_02895 [Candidatus Gottesmanbacteria bacterium RIFCSPHIGHO2_02_FULL_39_11]